MQKLQINPETWLTVVRTFSKGPNDVSVAELPNGSFCYMDGSPVTRKSDLNFLPKVHKERAWAWWDENQREPQKEKLKADYEKRMAKSAPEEEPSEVKEEVENVVES